MDIERFNFNKIFRDIERHVDVRLKTHQSKRTQTDAKFYEAFETLSQILGPLKEHQKALSQSCSKYDFVKEDGTPVKGNGYRSLLFLLSCLLQPLSDVLAKISKNIGNLTFSSGDAINNLCIYCRALQGMKVLMHNAAILMQSTPSPDLFNDGAGREILVRALASEYLCRDVYYGKLHGFQYAPTMKPLLYMVNVAMASYEQWYNADRGESIIRQLVTSIFKGGRYMQNSSKRGLKLDKLTSDTSVHFVKAFWSLLEGDAFRGAMKVIGPSVEVKQSLEVPAKTIKIEGSKGEVELTPPTSDLGFKPIPLVLLSHKWREGQEASRTTSTRNAPKGPATGLVIHMHGGGYVAQSPQSHEFYLRKWSSELETPIVSIDYTLSPEGPFPRPLDECVMAYAWILQNTHRLGTTAEKIILVGDSAGGNFSITVAIKAKELGLRLPDAILSVYPSTNSTSAACPSRIMAVVDPILPLGIMQACQHAYSGQLPTDEELMKRRDCREKVHRARGYYTQDPDSKDSPSLRSRSESKASREPPERPPPPSSSSLRQMRRRNEGYAKMGDTMDDIPLNGEDEDHSDGAEALDKEPEDSLSTQSLLPTLPKCCVPIEGDTLSEPEIEELITEVMKSYQAPPCTNDPYMSPVLATADMLTGLPPVYIVGAALDPVLDDAVSMAQKLKSVGQPVNLDIVPGLPHGFLCMVSLGNNSDLNHAHRLCLTFLRKELGLSPLLQRQGSRRGIL